MNNQNLIDQLFDVGNKLTEMEIALDICEQSHMTIMEGVKAAIEAIECGRIAPALEMLQTIAYGWKEEEEQNDY